MVGKLNSSPVGFCLFQDLYVIIGKFSWVAGLIGYCPYCGRVRQLVYYSNVDAWQCVCCGGLVKSPRRVEQGKLD